jgi:hypothetical protein
MMDVAYRFLSARLADDVVENIARRVHEGSFAPALSDIRSRRSAFEAAIDDGRDPIAALRNAEMHYDDEIDWWSALVTFDETKFVFLHDYVDNLDTDLFLVEGRVDKSKNSMSIERFYYRNHYTRVERVAVKYMRNVVNLIPFEWTMDVLGVDTDIDCADCSSSSGKRWADPTAVIEWFALQPESCGLPSPALMEYLGLVA